MTTRLRGATARLLATGAALAPLLFAAAPALATPASDVPAAPGPAPADTSTAPTAVNPTPNLSLPDDMNDAAQNSDQGDENQIDPLAKIAELADAH